ncbi:PREDICTED: sterol 26-hydroxylase, mitochondrial-like [Priapulus caudatus]|uniref:Sterol 26-hydroxylase, mitochondrial-like n=1 Tax=Priapulus caudatus TaxID=37621 RepID=A0ABM1F3U3_PRICU|nr:PREDICTED: sterol 26-hydroxylase, mitochondrial-like [Priapulus caudatus]
MPGPTWSPVVGKLLRRHDIKRMHWANADKCRRHGGIVREQVARRSHVVLLYEPRDVEAMFRHEGRHPLRPHFEPLVAYRRSKGMTLGIGFLQGEEWYKLRCILQKVMMDPMAAVPYLEAEPRLSSQRQISSGSSTSGDE